MFLSDRTSARWKRPGRKPLFTAAVRERLRGWLGAQPDLTLGELQEQLREQVQLGVSRPSLWLVLRQMGLRLKKSHSMPGSGTAQRIAGSGKSMAKDCAPLRRSG